jgi:anti-sigma regulatory factor (Ser/Thr protein kinase)
MLPARLGELRALRAFLEAFCAEAAIGRDGCLRLNLLLEELFTNTVRHGHRGDCDAPVWVSLARGAERCVRVSYEDTARAFNPFEFVSPDTTQEIRKLDGRGLLLLETLTVEREYAYLYGRNCIRLAVSPD